MLPDNRRAFAIGAFINLLFVGVEVVYGLMANSLALLADAGHNLGDVMGLLMAWGAASLARRVPTRRFTYGFGGTTILAALANAMLLLLATGAIVFEALQRLHSPEPVATGTIIAVAVAGILINGSTALLFLHGSAHDLNSRSAYLHLASDAAVSLGVVIAAIVIGYTGGLWLDPVTSLVLAAVIITATWGVLRDSVGLALHAVPSRIDPARVRSYLESQRGVHEVHDLHIWAMSTTDVALTAHLVMPEGHPGDDFLAALCKALNSEHRIGHATFQIEAGDGETPCLLAPESVV